MSEDWVLPPIGERPGRESILDDLKTSIEIRQEEARKKAEALKWQAEYLPEE